jgi:hypothetical protein
MFFIFYLQSPISSVYFSAIHEYFPRVTYLVATKFIIIITLILMFQDGGFVNPDGKKAAEGCSRSSLPRYKVFSESKILKKLNFWNLNQGFVFDLFKFAI